MGSVPRGELALGLKLWLSFHRAEFGLAAAARSGSGGISREARSKDLLPFPLSFRASGPELALAEAATQGDPGAEEVEAAVSEAWLTITTGMLNWTYGGGKPVSRWSNGNLRTG